MTKETKKILMNDADDSDEKTIQDDSNSENYQRVVPVSSSGSDSESEAENDR